MIKYRVRHNTYNIEQVEAIDSERFWVVDNAKYHKTGSGYYWFDTYHEAWLHCIERAENEVSGYTKLLNHAQEALNKLIGV